RLRLEQRGDVELALGAALERVDPRQRTVTIGGRTHGYRKLVSTIPLPQLVERIEGVPQEIRDAAAALRSVRWRWLDVATRTPAPIPEHWIYVPDPEVPFFRVGIYSNAAPATAPAGCSGLYVELADRERDPDLPAILAALADMGAISSPADVLFTELREIEHAYVVFDEAHGPATTAIHGWLGAQGIRSCGRYGAWVYSSMEDALQDGMEAAAWLQQ
ncbi:MAG: hypothetical protein IAG13_25200, partial [Deltaproteobacteria bacterium]|nr:hypothetical protein [Nannocystaceae bacterium]